VIIPRTRPNQVAEGRIADSMKGPTVIDARKRAPKPTRLNPWLSPLFT